MELTTKDGYSLLTIASALQKSIRRGDVRLAGWSALQMFPQYTNYAWKRLLTVSAEDCADIITQEIKALYDSFEIVNKGSKEKKGRIFISKAVIILCKAVKNRDSDILQNYVVDKKIGITDENIENLIKEIENEKFTIPNYVYDVHTMEGKRRGKTKADFFIEEEEAINDNRQMTLFPEIDFRRI